MSGTCKCVQGFYGPCSLTPDPFPWTIQGSPNKLHFFLLSGASPIPQTDSTISTKTIQALRLTVAHHARLVSSAGMQGCQLSWDLSEWHSRRSWKIPYFPKLGSTGVSLHLHRHDGAFPTAPHVVRTPQGRHKVIHQQKPEGADRTPWSPLSDPVWGGWSSNNWADDSEC